MAKEYFLAQFQAISSNFLRMDLEALGVPKLSPEKIHHLEQPFLSQEIQDVVFKLNLNKALGTDGFTSIF